MVLCVVAGNETDFSDGFVYICTCVQCRRSMSAFLLMQASPSPYVNVELVFSAVDEKNAHDIESYFN